MQSPSGIISIIFRQILILSLFFLFFSYNESSICFAAAADHKTQQDNDNNNDKSVIEPNIVEHNDWYSPQLQLQSPLQSPLQYSALSNMSYQPTNGLRSVIYYVNWAIYARNHLPQHLPAQQFTHILYSFANIRPETGEVYLTDTWSDTDKHFDGDSWNDTGNNVYGCIKQFYLLKKQNRHMKVLLSIGGWTYSSNFAQATSAPEKRAEFVRSAIKLLEDLGLDGLDVDWEYPQDATQAQNYVELLRECRHKLNEAASKRTNKSTYFYLSAAVPAGRQNYEKLMIPEMDQALDFWNLMAYDYAGSWDQTAGHQANLYPDRNSSQCTPFNTVDAVEYYLSHGVSTPHKLVLGMPLYGRDFLNTNGPGQAYQGIGPGSFEQGVWDYKALPQPGAKEVHDPAVGASWSYDGDKRSMVSYDTPSLARQKADYVTQRGLGGGMWWESSCDKPLGQGSLVQAFWEGCGGGGANQVLDRSENCLEYPESKYDNIRTGMQT